ncbi:hypothetical protein L917_18653 [Phytophthora nicotianae]|uniref:Uncharacterized protein n=1 Tax=Phytophthora nicotianae TaxID=4792 RepID=W2K6U9_PHYNI|nr:hypothetical protein L917_18653 [Phytophthora nicotianae]
MKCCVILHNMIISDDTSTIFGNPRPFTRSTQN